MENGPELSELYSHPKREHSYYLPRGFCPSPPFLAIQKLAKLAKINCIQVLGI
jgi:hypothetical protein